MIKKKRAQFNLIGESDGVSIPISRFWCESETPQVKTSNELKPLEPNPKKCKQCNVKITRVLIRILSATGCVFNLKRGACI